MNLISTISDPWEPYGSPSKPKVPESEFYGAMIMGLLLALIAIKRYKKL
jgi:hypothetical protein